MTNRRLLLIAMSGVRVRDRKLLDRGMTLPGFVERSRVIASLPSLGLLALAAHTPPHWHVEYREFDAERPHVDGPCDLVAISALSARVFEAYALADDLRAAGYRVVLGGLHVSALPDEAAAHADAVVVGEGEAVWADVIADAEAGRLRPRYGPRPFHLALSRTPRYDLLDVSRYNRLTLQTQRGCPLDCTFCGASRTISSFKVKPVDLVRRDLDAIRAIWPRPFVELADDNTFAHRRHSRELLALLAAHPLRWFTETDLSVADDPLLLDALAASGCAQVLVGLESVNRDALADVDSRGWKLAQRDVYIEKIRRIQAHGISVNGCFVLGFDHDDAGVFDRTRDFVRESGLAEVQITLLTPFPGTALHAKLARDGRLLARAAWDRCTLFDLMFRPARMSVEELETGFRRLMSELYNPAETARRRGVFRECLRTRRQSHA